MSKSRILLVPGALVLLAAVIAARPRQPASPAASPVRWYKGNLHTHTLNSDGDSTPDEVVTWYREHGYQFLVLTDHNYLTNVDGLNALHGAAAKFLVIKGEEATGRVDGKAVHLNGLEVERLVDVPAGGTVVDVAQGMVDGIRAANGIPSINHPNYEWGFSAEQLDPPQRTRLLEVFK